MKPQVDWTTFEGRTPSLISCRCGTRYPSHAKVVALESTIALATKHACPGCGADHDHVTAVCSPSEVW